MPSMGQPQVTIRLVLQSMLGRTSNMKQILSVTLLKSLREVWYRFANVTSIHGLKFVMDKQGNACSRYVWIDDFVVISVEIFAVFGQNNMDAAHARWLRGLDHPRGDLLATVQEQSDTSERRIIACAAQPADSAGHHVLPDQSRRLVKRLLAHRSIVSLDVQLFTIGFNILIQSRDEGFFRRISRAIRCSNFSAIRLASSITSATKWTSCSTWTMCFSSTI